MASDPRGPLALVLSGGGARAAYQLGLLRHLARVHPDVDVRIITGVSAGAVNAAGLAARRGGFAETVERMARLWCELSVEMVFELEATRLLGNVARWAGRLLSGGHRSSPTVRGLVDTAPLAALVRDELDPERDGLEGIRANVRSGRIDAVAVTATSYATGQTVTFVEGRDAMPWRRSNRLAVTGPLQVEHVLASASLPLLFPATEIDGRWYGDGGVRLTAPLSPALHLGAGRLLACSTRYVRTSTEEDVPDTTGYPPPARVAGLLMNAIFLDVFDQDAERLARINELLRGLREEDRGGMRVVDHVLVRPSQDLGVLAGEYEPQLPRTFRYLLRGLGTRQTRSNDVLSLLMFQGDYLRRLVELGERDAAARGDEIAALVG